jgi:hypothetical protein
MDDLTKRILSELSNGGLTKIGEQLGMDEAKADSALSTAMPVLVSALANNAAKPGQAQALMQALDKDHDGSILSDVGSYLGNAEGANGAGILGHVLGDQQSVIAQNLAKQAGLDAGQVDGLLKMAAPLVMGALGEEKQKQGLDPDMLADFLGGQQKVIDDANPMISNLLTSFLDKDKDGSFLDDLLGMILGFFRKK